MKYLFTLIICCIVNFSSSAQLRGGIKLGTNATFIINETSSFKNIPDRFERGNGYQIGLEASYLLLNTIGLLAETSYQNNEFNFTYEKLVDKLPNGENSSNALVNENIKVSNGSFRFGLALLLDFGKFGLSLGSDLGFLTSSKGEVLRSYFKDSMSVSINEEITYDFLHDQVGEEGAYWNLNQDKNQLFDRLNFGANIAFRYDLFSFLGFELKTNYGFGDVLNDLSQNHTTGGFGRQLDLLISAKYTFPIKFKKKKKEEEIIEEEIEEIPIVPKD